MKNQLLIITASTLLGLASCKSDVVDNGTPPPTGTTPPTTGTTTTSTSPVETNPPNATYSPAFTGQTRIAGVRSTTSYASNVLRSPWGVRGALPAYRMGDC